MMSSRSQARGKGKPRIYVEGMHGFGDNFHQLAVIRQLVKTHEVWLETSWPSLYDGLPVHFVARGTKLRTQLKHREAEAKRFTNLVPYIPKRIKITYTREEIYKYGSVIGAMMRHVGFNENDADFKFTAPQEWLSAADDLIKSWNTQKPILFYRPLVVRTEWNNCEARNPDYFAYAELLNYIRERFFIVSIADVVPQVEWIVGRDIKADKEYHHGEIPFNVIVGLIARSALVYASAGFALPAARSVGTPAVCVFGLFENSSSFSRGYGPYLGIDPIKPCTFVTYNSVWSKKIDMEKAKQKIKEFVDALPSQN